MSYKSNVTVNGTLLKDVTFWINDNSITFEHVGFPEMNLKPGMILEIGIVDLMLYPQAVVYDTFENTVTMGLWDNATTKRKHPFRKKKKETVPTKTGRNNFTVG